ncbi:caspase domain-containing protein [Armillaria novae-zelandiae]|uniref:Caspase domain-containing protein n=1 Tax=Armillaria novae-zelandiae TaxID=153914 RepID=A0AA39P1E3_9AGAR|nr:caspase domain-containing protein [Armillaria novae-zelandiae]
MGVWVSKLITVINAIFSIEKDQQSRKKSLSDHGHRTQPNTTYNRLSCEISLKRKDEEHIARNTGVTMDSHDHVSFLSKVWREGNLAYTKFLTRLNALRIQYFKLSSSLFGPHKTSNDIDASRSWAVVIGIDAYENIGRLNGCVTDAQSFEEYLTKFGVPEERIQLLLGPKKEASPTSSKYPDDLTYPTRTNITTTLRSLINNPHIERGNNIIIYYAGHGASYPYSGCKDVENPDHQEICSGNTRSIEAFCPIDCHTVDKNGKPVHDISNREFNTILTLISRAKGHYITVILDCCHAAGVSREVPQQGAPTCRMTEPATLTDMLHVGHKFLKDLPGYRSILDPNWTGDEESHVLLAACKADQVANEMWMDKEDGSPIAETTYVDLLDRLGSSRGQTPVIAGRYRHDRLWYQAATHTTCVENGGC